MTCPNCAEPLAERGVFCKACAGQARCMKCRELLEPGAMACVECGTRVGQPVDGADGTATQTHPVASTIPVNRNTLSYHEDRNSRRVEASLTDAAMHGLGDVFGELFAQRGVGRVTPPGVPRTFIKDVVLDETKQLPPAPPSNDNHQTTSTRESSTTPVTDKNRILKFFAANGEMLELTDNRLKTTTAADYCRRLTYLFV